MDTNVQALKNLYVALGGEASDVAELTTSSEVITAMESVAASAASELPVVKPADEGKTLTVNSSGKWAAIMPEVPEQNTVIIPCSIVDSKVTPDENAPVRNCDAIFNLVSSGKEVIFRVNADGSNNHEVYRIQLFLATGRVLYATCFKSTTPASFVLKMFSVNGWLPTVLSAEITQATYTPPTVPEA